MAQIFISHSRADKSIIHFLLEAFAGTKVRPHLEELEKELPSGVTAAQIKRDIEASNAVFILLSESVEHLTHTRDWINWECGVAVNKQIMILEPFESLRHVRVVVPRFDHYILYDQTELWRKYLRSIIETFDDSHVLPTLAATTGGGALLNERDRGGGATAGFLVGLAGLILDSVTQPSYGIQVKCWKCFSTYKVHRYGNFRCAVCNADSFLHEPQPVSVQTVNT